MHSQSRQRHPQQTGDGSPSVLPQKRAEKVASGQMIGSQVQGELFGRCWVSFSKFKTRLPYHFGQTVKSKTTIYKVWCLLLDTTKRWGETNTRWCLFANHFENKYAHQVGNHFPKFLGKQFQKSLKPPARLPWYRWVQRKSQSKFYETHPDSSSIIHKAPKHPVIRLGC